jgi:hypothetical protein
MNVEQLIKNFNKTGVFPTDDQLLTAVASDLNYYSIYHLEMQLIEIARNDVNHPYHNAVSKSYNDIVKLR